MKLLTQLIVGALITVLHCFVIQIGWGWFVTPAFNIAVPSLPIIVGLFYVGQLFQGRFFDSQREVSWIETFVTWITIDVVVLIVMFITHLFM